MTLAKMTRSQVFAGFAMTEKIVPTPWRRFQATCCCFGDQFFEMLEFFLGSLLICVARRSTEMRSRDAVTMGEICHLSRLACRGWSSSQLHPQRFLKQQHQGRKKQLQGIRAKRTRTPCQLFLDEFNRMKRLARQKKMLVKSWIVPPTR